MNTVTDTTGVDTVSDGLTVSMVEVDAAAARTALADHLPLTEVDLEHPAAVAVLAAAAVVAAGWRPPAPAGVSRMVTIATEDRDAPALFGDDSGVDVGADSAGIGGDRSGPPGWPR